MRRLVLCLVFACATAHAVVRSFDATVTHVTDGDTVWVRAAQGGAPLPVRIEGIDAPEICQADGPQARDALVALVAQRHVRVLSGGQDDFGRTLARVELHGEDIGGWLVRHGHAWSYRFHNRPGPYAHEERLARQARLGLWREGHPTDPRSFRGWHGPCEHEPSRAR